MRANEIEHLITLFKGTPLFVCHFNFDDSKEYEHHYGADFVFELSTDFFRIDTDLFYYNDITKIECSADADTRIKMIRACDNIKDAFAIAKYRLTDEIEQALEEVRKRTTSKFSSQLQQLLSTIREDIAVKHAPCHAESVLEHLCLNMLGDSEMRSAVEQSVFHDMLKRIPETVDKLSRKERF